MLLAPPPPGSQGPRGAVPEGDAVRRRKLERMRAVRAQEAGSERAGRRSVLVSTPCGPPPPRGREPEGKHPAGRPLPREVTAPHSPPPVFTSPAEGQGSAGEGLHCGCCGHFSQQCSLALPWSSRPAAVGWPLPWRRGCLCRGVRPAVALLVSLAQQPWAPLSVGGSPERQPPAWLGAPPRWPSPVITGEEGGFGRGPAAQPPAAAQGPDPAGRRAGRRAGHAPPGTLLQAGLLLPGGPAGDLVPCQSRGGSSPFSWKPQTPVPVVPEPAWVWGSGGWW